MPAEPTTLNFGDFFQVATGNPPYDYQCRLAEGPCESRLITIPTGLGKTAAVVLAWLWNRVGHPDETHRVEWPRRLVYCLPMRTLVEQTDGEAHKWLDAHGLLWLPDKDHCHQGKVGLHILMGGEDTEDWDLYPEENAILIGTQDMLLSRALNRGYGMSRYRWPMHFGLLNNDCLWVFDETQLMGVGVKTSAQFDGFRSHALPKAEGLPTVCATWWMSATLERSRLATVDHPAPSGGWLELTLNDGDRAQPLVKARLESVKLLRASPISLGKGVKEDQYAGEVAALALAGHIAGSLTLIIVNRVPRAQGIYEALRKAGRTQNVALIHSRFRKPDRVAQQRLLIEGAGDRIVVATQAIEAGVDVSARVLITELAPWSSLVQRFGRCNRSGEFNLEGAEVHWIDLAYQDDKDTAPYLVAELNDSRIVLQGLNEVGPKALENVRVEPAAVVRPVVRRKDLIDLFDTTPDLAGHDLDVSRYIRDGDDNDVQVFWRDLNQNNFQPTSSTPEPHRDELCRVAVYRFQTFIAKLNKSEGNRKVWAWEGLNEKWIGAPRARPGGVYLIDHRAGGYEPTLGWTGEVCAIKKETEWVPPIMLVSSTDAPDSFRRDAYTMIGRPLTLTEHTGDVVETLKHLLAELTLKKEWGLPLLIGAQWHDVGKALDDFQKMLRSAAGEQAPQGLLAKSGTRGGVPMPPWRRQFRHELASALAWLANNDTADQRDLVAYIIAAHHGKVRLSIRSLPDEQPPPDRDSDLMARGVIDGDELPETSMDGVSMPKTILHLDLMRMGNDAQGRPSWLSRMIALRDHIGPFGLAYLETLLRVADMRASAAESRSRA